MKLPPHTVMVQRVSGWIGRIEVGHVERMRTTREGYQIPEAQTAHWERFGGGQVHYRIGWYGRLPDELMPHPPHVRPNLLAVGDARGIPTYIIWEAVSGLIEANGPQRDWWAEHVQPLIDHQTAKDLEWMRRDPAEISARLRGMTASMRAGDGDGDI